MNKEDIKAEIEMSFKQIIAIIDLMLDCNDENSPNILTIRDLAQRELEKHLQLY